MRDEKNHEGPQGDDEPDQAVVVTLIQEDESPWKREPDLRRLMAVARRMMKQYHIEAAFGPIKDPL